MKPIYSVLSINASFLIILWILFYILLEGINFMPPFLIVLGMINLMLGAFFLFTKNKEFGWAFLAGFALVLVAGVISVLSVVDSLA